MSGPDAWRDEPTLEPTPELDPIPNGSNRSPMAAAQTQWSWKDTFKIIFHFLAVSVYKGSEPYVLGLVWPGWLPRWRTSLPALLLSAHQGVQTGHWGGHCCWRRLSDLPGLLDEERKRKMMRILEDVQSQRSTPRGQLCHWQESPGLQEWRSGRRDRHKVMTQVWTDRWTIKKIKAFRLCFTILSRCKINTYKVVQSSCLYWSAFSLFLPGNLRQTVVRWGLVTGPPHWEQNKSKILLLTDHSGPLGHSGILPLDCLLHPEGCPHLQIQEKAYQWKPLGTWCYFAISRWGGRDELSGWRMF